MRLRFWGWFGNRKREREKVEERKREIDPVNDGWFVFSSFSLFLYLSLSIYLSLSFSHLLSFSVSWKERTFFCPFVSFFGSHLHSRTGHKNVKSKSRCKFLILLLLWGSLLDTSTTMRFSSWYFGICYVMLCKGRNSAGLFSAFSLLFKKRMRERRRRDRKKKIEAKERERDE